MSTGMNAVTSLFSITTLFLCLPVQINAAKNDQQPLQESATATNSNLAKISQLFSSTTATSNSASATATTAPCCGADCPPGYCNIHHPAIDSITDVAWLYPTPTAAAPSSSLTFPCCHAACPDGACRPSPGYSSERPPIKARQTPAPESPGGGNELVPPGQRHPIFGPGRGQDPDNAGCWGCAPGCVGCIFSLRPHLPGQATDTAAARAPKPTDALSIEKQADRCFGCAGGWCYPCRGEKIIDVVGLPPDQLLQDASSSASGAAAKMTDAVKSAVGAQDKDGDANGPQLADPSLLLGNDVVDGIIGIDQDIVPIMVQGFASKAAGSIAEVSGTETFELLTLLATLDTKVSENYISLRVVRALGQEDKITASKFKEPKKAVLNSMLDSVQTSGWIEMGIVIGSIIGGEQDSHRLLKGVKWNVYDDEGVSNVPGFVLGTKLLGEVGGLRTVESVSREVEAGARIVGVAHAIISTGGNADAVEQRKDEL
ncbi:uncharacterized protein AB675_5110 [Cyphellophora attinorum]|uniref:Uncharacterized protein n=1 Tax=Cyphellophora attinorum TaxID=1664694 RepID=A0A0N1H878_9EURO|nr:uncharacterized protein AB675_5110 [Phialophora attinorum]KPI39466.1 hypothetical protein AB675_5110 [Phialophora attinorum]